MLYKDWRVWFLYLIVIVVGLAIGVMLSRYISKGTVEPMKISPTIDEVTSSRKVREIQIDIMRSIVQYDNITVQIHKLSDDAKRNRETIDSLNVQRLSLSTRIRRALEQLSYDEWPKEAARFARDI